MRANDDTYPEDDDRPIAECVSCGVRFITEDDTDTMCYFCLPKDARIARYGEDDTDEETEHLF